MSEALAEPVAAGDAADAALVDETPAPQTDPAPPAPAAAEPEFSPAELRADIEYLREQNNRFTQAFEVLMSRGQTAGEAAHGAAQASGIDQADLTDEFGNLNPAALVSLIQNQNAQTLQALDQRIQTLTQPIQQQQQQQAIAEGEQQMRDVIKDDFSRNGDLIVNNDAVEAKIIENVRNIHYPQMAQRYGETNRAAELAIERAVSAERDYQKQIADAAVERHVNRNTELAGATRQPGAGAVGITTRPEGPRKAGELARQYGQSADRIRYGAGT